MAAIAAHKTDDSIIDITPENFPAVYAGPSEGSSKRYVHVPTNEFIPVAQEAGWDVFNAGMKKRNSRSIRNNPDSVKTAHHFVAFRPSDAWLTSRGLLDNLRFDGGIGRLSKATPRLVVYNSHDTTRKLKAVLGLYEFICSNSAIMCSESWGEWSIRHVNIDVQKIMRNFFVSVLEGACHVLDYRNEMEKIDVTKPQALDYASRVIDLRWNGDAYSVEPADLIACHHNGQEEMTAYNIFQRVQENMIKPGIYATAKNPGKQNPRRKQTGIKDFHKDLEINKGLFEAANQWLGDMGKQLPPPPNINMDIK